MNEKTILKSDNNHKVHLSAYKYPAEDYAGYISDNAKVYYDLYKYREILIKYVNYAGVTSHRKIIPDCIQFMKSKWHDNGKPTWILIALDCEKMQGREFRLLDIEGQI